MLLVELKAGDLVIDEDRYPLHSDLRHPLVFLGREPARGLTADSEHFLCVFMTVDGSRVNYDCWPHTTLEGARFRLLSRLDEARG